MLSLSRTVLGAASVAAAGQALSLSDVCTTAYATAAVPAADFLPGITLNASSVTTALVMNSTASNDWYITKTISYCNVTIAYSHNGIPNDLVHVSFWVPEPDKFENRYVTTGGSGLSINAGAVSNPTGVIVGAVSGYTDGGFGTFDSSWDEVFLLANNTVNWQSVYMMGYQAHWELATLGKEFTKNFFNVSDKVYSYYQACSEGGREGWSQLQRFADLFDGATIGAPALRYGQQQVNHLSASVTEQTLGYYPPSCELEKLVNLTIAFCDPLDGQTDGVVSRSDLCKLYFDVNSTIGEPYYCAASSGGSSGPGKRQLGGGSTTPEQNGTITAQGAKLAQALWNGLHDSQGKRVYIYYQPGADFGDASTTYNSDTREWEASISSLGGQWVAQFLELQDVDNLSTLDNVTYDTLKEWMIYGMQKYGDSLQTTEPDVSAFANAGGKVIHVHGEQDPSIPAASSIHYYESVRNVMFPNMTFNSSTEAMDGFYRLFLVPGGAHCGANTEQPGGGWPATTLQTMIEWVENGIAPTTLNNTGATVPSLCKWPLRPLWSKNGSSFNCIYDQASWDSWIYDFDAYSTPLY
ncbi:feruloyl esteras-like protein B precursor [Ilyonectria sp. MPI-CAGE-AT-0026]|nr:feruloyl esteras-like protein B precursor [Ilyonectria sp. MPI-CAGE-AT-0026]